MGDTAIEWTDVVWNPTRGCSRISPGCGGGTPGPRKGGCYAERMAIRMAGPGQPYEGLVESTPAGPRWTGKVVLDEGKLEEPLRWRTPRKVFVNSMSDLFHEALAEKDIVRVFAVMALSRRHTFQVLTKRADVMARTVGHERFRKLVLSLAATEAPGHGIELEPGALHWPLRNVWLGVSVEDQRRADERIPHLLATPAAVRFLSCEPLLGPVDLWHSWLSVPEDAHTRSQHVGSRIDWVIAGHESGPGARDTKEDWVRALRDQCVATGTRFFYKQRVERGRKVSLPELDGRHWVELPEVAHG